MARIQTLACDLMSAKGDKRTFFAKLKASGCKGIRVFGSILWGNGAQIQPFEKVGTWTHSISGETFSLYDLDRLSLSYFIKVRGVMSLCKEFGQVLVWTFLDYRSPDKHTKYWSPFKCNKQNISGGIYGKAVVPYQVRYMRRVMYWADKLKVDMRWEIANEFSLLDTPDNWKKDCGDPNRPLTWYTEILGALRTRVDNYEKGYTLPPILAGVIHSGALRKEITALGPKWCYHCIGKASQVQAIGNQTCWLSGDGFFLGDGDPDQKGRRGVGLAAAREIGPLLKPLNAVMVYEWMCRRLWLRDNNNANLDDFAPGPLEAMVKGAIT